jgi:hypothetical protein
MQNIPQCMKTLADRALCRLIFDSSPAAAASVIAQDDTKAIVNIIENFAQNSPQYSCLASKMVTLIQKSHQKKENGVAKDLDVSVGQEFLVEPMTSMGTTGETTVATSLSVLTVDNANDLAISDAIDSETKDHLETQSGQFKEEQELEKALKALPEYQELLQAYEAACQRYVFLYIRRSEFSPLID